VLVKVAVNFKAVPIPTLSNKPAKEGANVGRGENIMRRLLVLTATMIVCNPLYAEPSATNQKTISWAGCGISKNAFMNEMVAAYEKKTGVKVNLVGGGATKGIRQVSNKQVNIGGTCRHTLVNQNTLRADDNERRVQLAPVAWDALVVIVHKDNPVDNISLDQLRAVYKGEVTNWKQLGGNDAPLELYVRKGKISGVGRTLRELLFYNYDEEFVAKHVMDSSGPLERAIDKDPNSFGVTGVSSARKLVKSKTAKILKLEGKEASYNNIKTGQYLLYRPLYIVTRVDEKDPEVKKFVHFVSSDEGAKIMRSVGTVPYEDAIGLWMTYLEQQNRALASRLHVDPKGPRTVKN
jgi:phosphate transport system substrate-binding protein